MEPFFRAIGIYLFLLIIIRISGRRTLAQMTSFDAVLLLIISEATQQALLGEDNSMMNAAIVIVSLVGLDIGLSVLKLKFPGFGTMLDGKPLVLVDNGKPLRERMKKSRVDEDEILASARESHGIGKMEDIRYAVLETDGGISIIPKNE